MPVIGARDWTLAPWRLLFALPGLERAVLTSLTVGFLSTALALILVIGLLALARDTLWLSAARRTMALLLAMPHAAVALGLAFLLSSSGWVARMVSPWATGWVLPPDWPTIQDPWGFAMVAALLVKESAFLLLMALAVESSLDSVRSGALARSLGHAPGEAWLRTVLPRLYPRLRLPVYAVLAYGLSTVEVALVLGPTTPPPLSVLVTREFLDPDLSRRLPAAAGALLQLGLVVGGIGLWALGERILVRLARPWLSAGPRGRDAPALRLAARLGPALVLPLGLGGLVGMGLWSVTGQWRWPDALPRTLSTTTWSRQADALAWPLANSLSLGLAVALFALLLSLGCLEAERRSGRRPGRVVDWLVYAPLLVPQVGFLFGVQILLLAVRLDGTWIGVAWSHLLFVLPYVFLTLAGPYRRLDPRHATVAACLGAGPLRVFLVIVLPLLARPILAALAVGFAVGLGLYLPTILVGAGHWPTLTTEAVALASGANRRIIGVYAILQAALPLAAFALAVALPAWMYRDRAGMGDPWR
ncbi:MAG: ABC transporter permease subunit [Rhodospirillum sp.]|nr:ABC transporter permease subunit [Rhodospirillum sp.]MCF8488165.1 ABC transporter permease subunit [Rhodospirillum sp.]MCF8499465.1 ABC transporter permease subunit [Rhodospirillum sp.]